MVYVTSNSSFQSALVELKSSSAKLTKAIEKVASGKQINSSSDDAAGLSVAVKMINQIRGIEAGINSAQTAVSAIEAALSGVSSASDISLRLYELAVQASNGTYTPSDRQIAQIEATALTAEFSRIAENTKINEQFLLDGSFSRNFQTGSSTEESIKITIPGIARKNDIAASVDASAVDKPTLIKSSYAVGTSDFNIPETSDILITEPGKLATGSSVFDTPATSQTANVSTYDFKSTTEANASSNFDTPSTSSASGSSSISILNNNTANVVNTNYNNVNLGTTIGTSAIEISSNEFGTVSSSLDYLSNSPIVTRTSSATGVPASSTAEIATASNLNPLNFANPNFGANDSSSSQAQSGTTISIPGWSIGLNQVSLDGTGANNSIGGFPTPAPAPGSASDAASVTGVGGAAINFSYTDQGNELTLRTNDITTNSNGVAHGPYIISDSAISLNTGDTVSFDWESTGVGGDFTDVYAYLLDVTNGNALTMLDYTSGSSGAVAKQTVSKTLAGGEAGMYKLVYISGAYDSDGGGIVGSETKISNISVTESTPGASTTTSADVIIQARESGGVTIARSKLGSLDTIASNNAGANANPYSITGTDAALFTINQGSGEITSSALSRANKTSYSFTVTYERLDGGMHTENVTLNLQAALGATTNLTAQEGGQININLSDLTILNDFFNTAGNGGGSFSIDPTSTDAAKFTVVNSGTGQIRSTALDYDTQQSYSFKLLYQVNGESFENTVTLNISDTLTSTSSVTSKEADNVKLLINNFTSSQTYKTNNPGPNNYQITGTDAGKFTFDANGDIISTQGLYLANQGTYRFNLEYTEPLGDTHIEAVTLNLTQSLKSNSTVYVDNNATATINPTIFNNINRFASGQAGSWAITSNATDPGDHLEFSMPNTSTGVITSNNVTNYSTENRFDFDISFTKSSDNSTYTESVTMFVRNPSSITTTLTAEETRALSIDRTKFASIENAYQNQGTGGQFSLTGTNAGLFNISNEGVITSKNPMVLQGSRTYNFADRYNFEINYIKNGTTFTEQVILNVTQALQSQSNLSAAEAQAVNLQSNTFQRLNAFAARDRFRGSYQLQNGYGDNHLFNHDGSGNLTSKSTMEFNERTDHKYDLKLIYTAFNSSIFTDNITLTLTDTFSSTSTISVEESDQVTIPLDNLSASKNFKSRYLNGVFSLSGTDAGFFEVNTTTGNIVSVAAQKLLRSVKNSYNFNLVYRLSDGTTHTDNITLTPTESLQSNDVATSQEGNVTNLFIDRLLLLRSFASRDGNGGSFSISGIDGDLFKFNNLGNIESKAPILYGARGNNQYSFNVSYTETLANGGDTFTAQVVLDITETFTSTATISALEGRDIQIKIDNLPSSKTYATRHEGGRFSLTGTDQDKFTVNAVTGDIISKSGTALLRANQSTYQFSLVYLDQNGQSHTEAVTLNLNARGKAAIATARAKEAKLINLDLKKLVVLDDFVASKSRNGTYKLTGQDSELFEIVNDQYIKNISLIDYNRQKATPYRFNVVFESLTGDTFTEIISLYLSDTLASTAKLTTEEAEKTVIEFDTLRSSTIFESNNTGGKYYLSGTDARRFSLDLANRQIVSNQFGITSGNYDLSLNYQLNDYTTHSEKINLQILASRLNKSATNIDVVEAKQIKIENSEFSNLNQFAAADAYQGKFYLKSNDPNEKITQFFNIDRQGNVTSSPEFLIDFDKGRRDFAFQITYTKADGTNQYENQVQLQIQNDPTDDEFLILPQINLTTMHAAQSSATSIKKILQGLTSTEVYLGATKNQILFDMSYQLAKSMNSKIASSRIIDANMAKELTDLVKLRILNSASNAMIKNTMVAKRVAAGLLFGNNS